jgi:hypothetical protein
MNKLRTSYFLLVLSSILLVVNVYRLDFNNLQKENYWIIGSNLLLITAMIFSIRDLRLLRASQ